LNAIFHNWSFLAALAWEGYVSQGYGAVIVSLTDDNADVSYCGGALVHGDEQYPEKYNPGTEVVVVVRRVNDESVYHLSGRPSPEECYEQATARTMDATLH